MGLSGGMFACMRMFQSKQGILAITLCYQRLWQLPQWASSPTAIPKVGFFEDILIQCML